MRLIIGACVGYKEIYCSINTGWYPERGKDAQINIAAAAAGKIYLFSSANFKLSSKLGQTISFYVGYKLCLLHFRYCYLLHFFCISIHV